jgi:GntR family transcriptional regulator
VADPSSEHPLALEELTDLLRGRVLRAIDAGALAPGDRLPSAREWAGELGLDHRTVLAAVRVLVGEGLVETRERGGIYVSHRQGGGAGIPPLPESWFAEVLAQGLTHEIPVPDLNEWLRRCTETLRLRAVVVTSTADQAFGLCRELRDDFGLEAEAVTPAELPAPDAGNQGGDAPLPLPLRRADLIVATRAHEARARALGAMLRKGVVVTDVQTELVTGEWALLLRRPVYAVVATPQFGEMLRRFFADVPGVENLHVVVFGRDDLTSIPPGAPTYVTQHVRANLRGVEIPGRILPAARTIAASSAREILTFIVRSNVEAMRRLAR